MNAIGQGRAYLDVAKGIIMGWKRCSERTAFEEIVDASSRFQVNPMQLARELVRVVAGAGVTTSPKCSAALAACWGEFLRARDTVTGRNW